MRPYDSVVKSLRASRPIRLSAAGALTLALLAGCTSPGQLPDSWREAAPDRPVVELTFDVPKDLAVVAGTERIAFTPDLDVCELIFRAWPNKPATANSGSSLVVTDASVDGETVEPVVESAGAPRGAPGTLVTLPLPECIDAGTTVNAELAFEVTLGRGVDERVGRSRFYEMAWLGTAYPLLAWESGRGWATDPALPVSGETATSEVFELRALDVVAPSEFTVLGTGEAAGAKEDAGTGLTTHRFTAPAVRDVTVTVGALDVLTTEVDGVRVHLGAPIGSGQPLSVWSDEIAWSLVAVSEYLGPYPYSDLWASVIPDQTDGIEFPGAVQFGDFSPTRSDWIITHEVAHMWFYALVGNNQAKDPWLDESFASFVEAVVHDSGGDPEPSGAFSGSVAGELGQPMDYWTEFRRPSNAYVDGVYVAGSDALIEARQAAGADAFDSALRDYLTENAQQIATPSDVAEAFADLPAALRVLEDAGAL